MFNRERELIWLSSPIPKEIYGSDMFAATSHSIPMEILDSDRFAATFYLISKALLGSWRVNVTYPCHRRSLIC